MYVVVRLVVHILKLRDFLFFLFLLESMEEISENREDNHYNCQQAFTFQSYQMRYGQKPSQNKTGYPPLCGYQCINLSWMRNNGWINKTFPHTSLLATKPPVPTLAINWFELYEIVLFIRKSPHYSRHSFLPMNCSRWFLFFRTSLGLRSYGSFLPSHHYYH